MIEDSNRETKLLSRHGFAPLYIDLAAGSSVQSNEVSEGVVLDYDETGNLVGIDIDNASQKLDLTEVVTTDIPHRVGA